MEKVLFVCLGNICRSPLAEAIFNFKSQGLDFVADSAGTGAYHIGSQPDHRSIKVAHENGIPIHHKARQFHSRDFAEFDYVIAMDRNNHHDMSKQVKGKVNNLFLLRDFDPLAQGEKDVPDPYYGGYEEFENIYQIIDRSVDGLIQFIQRNGQ